MADKTLSPQVIPEQPFPDDTTATIYPSSSNAQGTNQFSPQVIPNRSMPQPVIAQHTISDSIDTQSKRIKASYQFDKSGAIKIGEYQNGVSGEIDISPNGLVARNKNNQETVTIDGDTGDATFLGTLQAGSLVSGDENVLIDKGSDGGGRIVLFNGGLPAIIIGDPS